MAQRCLVIDPSAMVRRVAARILRELDFEVAEARNTAEGLESCHAAMPDAIMLDWKAGPAEEGQSGAAEFITALREIAAKTQDPLPTIIFCTAERSVERIVEALKAGADEYIMKPFDSDVIESKLGLAGLLDPYGKAA